MITKKVKIKVNAKINFSLNVLGERRGMHLLDTIITSVNLADVITVCSRLDDKINIDFSNKNIDVNSSVVNKTCLALKEKFGDFGADIFVRNNVPTMCGLGGSSVDAVGALVALDKVYDFFSRGANVASMALKLGSDIPYMLKGGLGRVESVGERLSFGTLPGEFFVCILFDKFGVSTKECFNKFDEKNKDKKLVLTDNDRLFSLLESGDKNAFSLMKNALMDSAISLSPTIKSNLETLERFGATASFLTGSGNGCVGIFSDKSSADNAAKMAKEKGIFAVSTTTSKNGVEELL